MWDSVVPKSLTETSTPVETSFGEKLRDAQMAQHEKFLLVYSPHLHSVSIDLLNLYPSSPLWMGSYRTQSIFFIHFKIKIL